MHVKELIEILSTYPDDMDVYHANYNKKSTMITDVKFDNWEDPSREDCLLITGTEENF